MGRNNIHVLDMEDSKLLLRKEQIRWVGRIQDGLRDNRFRLYAQSIEPMSPRTGRQHYEILLRLQDKDGQIIDPGQFLSAAESFYLMANLDLWVINQAFSELADMRKGPCKRYCQLSINLSGQSLGDPHALASYIENKLEEHELEGQDICFEITESAAIENLDEASDFIETGPCPRLQVFARRLRYRPQFVLLPQKAERRLPQDRWIFRARYCL